MERALQPIRMPVAGLEAQVGSTSSQSAATRQWDLSKLENECPSAGGSGNGGAGKLQGFDPCGAGSGSFPPL